MSDLQPEPAKKRAPINTEYMQNFQRNFINKYSSLYFEKSVLEHKLVAADALILEQHQKIQKLMSKKKVHDETTQTDELSAETTLSFTTASTQTQCTGDEPNHGAEVTTISNVSTGATGKILLLPAKACFTEIIMCILQITLKHRHQTKAIQN